MKVKTKISFVLFIAFLCWIIVLQAQEYKYPKKEEINKRINYLQRVINEPIDNYSEIVNLGKENYEFALGNAILANDFKTAKKLERLISFGTRKVDKNNEIKYKVRFVKMNISPMAEALVLNSLTTTEWIED